MATIGSLIKSKLKSPIQRPLRTVESWTTGDENMRVAHFQKLWDYYTGDRSMIQTYTMRAMQILFKPETIGRMLLPYFNLTRRIINRLALAYKFPPERYIVVPTVDGVVDEKMKRSDENYQEMLLNSNINSQSKIWHRLSKLLDTVYVKPTFRSERMEFDIFAPHQIKVEEQDDNILLPKRVQYDIATPKGLKTVTWTDKEHWVEDDGVKLAEDNPWNGVNRYGILPFIPLRLRETENHWGEGDTQLVDINEKINILLASCYFNAILQSHGQPFAINLGLEGEIRTGPDWVLEAKNVTKDDFPPEFRFVQPEPATDENIKLIEFMVKEAAVMRGLSAASVSLEVAPESGAAKVIDNWELLEAREDDIEFLRPFEKALFNATRTVWNYHAKSQDRIDDKAKFGIDFILPKPPVSEQEEWIVKEMKYKYALWTPVDDMVDEDEGIDRATALEYVKKRLEEKRVVETARVPEMLIMERNGQMNGEMDGDINGEHKPNDEG